jgi:VCBS repeat-containing protein
VAYFAALAIAVGLGVPLAVLTAGLAQARTAAAGLESIARQPEASGEIRISMILGLAFIESLVIYCLVMAILLWIKLPADANVVIRLLQSAPAAVDDGYSVDEGETLNVPAPGVLGNDSDADGDALTAALASDATNGTLTLNDDGSFTYTPKADFRGTDSFTYRANDGMADSSVRTATITVGRAPGRLAQ